jgi:hypothetical protein
MAINYVQFVSEVQSIPHFSSLSSWERGKHGKTIQLEERWPWLILHLGETDANGEFKRNGQRRRTPVHNIGTISEDGEDTTAAKVDGLAADASRNKKGPQ